MANKVARKPTIALTGTEIRLPIFKVALAAGGLWP
jgi:hypothetical protein